MLPEVQPIKLDADVSPHEGNQPISPLPWESAYSAASLQKLMTATLMFPSCLTNVIPRNFIFMDGLLLFENDSAVKRRRPSPQCRSQDCSPLLTLHRADSSPARYCFTLLASLMAGRKVMKQSANWYQVILSHPPAGFWTPSHNLGLNTEKFPVFVLDFSQSNTFVVKV